MSDLFAWTSVLLPIAAIIALTAHLLVLRRRETALGWELAALQEEQATATVHRIRSEHTAELARAVHDDLGHRLTLAAIEAGVLSTRSPPASAPDLEHLRASIAECVEALNRSVADLTSGPDETSCGDIGEQVAQVVAAVRRAGGELEVDLSGADLTRISSASSGSAIVAVVREACTNALRHAPGSTIWLRAHSVRDQLVLEVENDSARSSARPPQGASGGHGLRGLSEQIERLGGSLSAAPRSGGWLVSARIPLRPASTVDAARQALAADQRRGRRRLVVLPAVLALVLVLLPVGAVVGQAALSRISPSAQAALRVGQPESEARARLPRLDMQSPPPQVGVGECHHYETTFSPFDRTDVIEVCFAGGRLASTTVIAAP